MPGRNLKRRNGMPQSTRNENGITEQDVNEEGLSNTIKYFIHKVWCKICIVTDKSFQIRNNQSITLGMWKKYDRKHHYSGAKD